MNRILILIFLTMTIGVSAQDDLTENKRKFILNSPNNISLFQTNSTDGIWASGMIAGDRWGIFEDATSTKEHLTILPGGNVGIGSTDPTANFEVYKYSGLSHARIYTNQHAGTAKLEIAGGTAGFGSQYSGWSFYHSYGDTNKDLYLRHGLSGGPDFVFSDSGNMGIGTSAPAAKLDVKGSVAFLQGAERLLWSSKHSGATDHRNYLAPRKSDDSGWDWNQEFGYHFYNRAWCFDGNVGIGTWQPDAKLAVNGNIHAKEVKVDLVGWPDYVFTEDYQLPSLKEVAKHIKEKGHLPNMPSASEVHANGVKLGEMDKLLLEKIEELTLYILQQQEEIDDLKKKTLQNNSTNYR